MGELSVLVGEAPDAAAVLGLSCTFCLFVASLSGPNAAANTCSISPEPSLMNDASTPSWNTSTVGGLRDEAIEDGDTEDIFQPGLCSVKYLTRFDGVP